MNHENKEAENDRLMPDGAAPEPPGRAQIEQRLQHVFHLAGDGEAVRQLMQMVVEYRLRQGQ